MSMLRRFVSEPSWHASFVCAMNFLLGQGNSWTSGISCRVCSGIIQQQRHQMGLLIMSTAVLKVGLKHPLWTTYISLMRSLSMKTKQLKYQSKPQYGVLCWWMCVLAPDYGNMFKSSQECLGGLATVSLAYLTGCCEDKIGHTLQTPISCCILLKRSLCLERLHDVIPWQVKWPVSLELFGVIFQERMKVWHVLNMLFN